MMRFLRFLSSLWKKFAELLGWINTRILLTIIYFLIITPLALVFRLSGKQFLDLGFNRATETYWQVRPDTELKKENYQRQF